MEEGFDKTFKYIPETINKLTIPNDAKLLNCYKTYKVSKETQQLLSEQGRSIFAEAFNEDEIKLLSIICVEALANLFGPSNLPAQIKKNPLELRVFYDSIKVDVPLQQSYCINDVLFWKRSLLQITKNPTLKFKKNINWKNRTISEKFENIIETQPVQFFPSDEFHGLSQLIKPFITDLHIQHLESLPLSHFDKYTKDYGSDYSFSEEELSEDDWLEFSEISSDSELETTSESSNSTLLKLMPGPSELTNSHQQINKIENEIRQMKSLVSAARAKNSLRKGEGQQLRKKTSYEYRSSFEGSLTNDTKSQVKKKKKRNYKSLFDIPIDSEDDEKSLVNFPAIIDSRNPEQLLEQQRRYNFPYKHCHHIDLSFLNWFTNLETLCLEFQGPLQLKDYHKRHLNFSYKDTRNLAEGISPLVHLRVFRLRNSRMNAKKLQIILNALNKMNSVQVVDFGNDALTDDCGIPMYLYLCAASGLLSLELEGNRFGNDFLFKLAYGIHFYEGPKLQYLGLARNELSHEGFHELMLVLCNTQHVKSLNLTAALLDEQAILCCIAQGILPKHKTMEEINLMAVPITSNSGAALRLALEANQTLLDLNVRGCDLEYEIEYEIEVLLCRNRHIKKHDFIGRTEATEQEVNEYFDKKKHPIYARVLEKVQKRIECLNNRPEEFTREKKFYFYEKRSEDIDTTSESGTSRLAMKPQIPFEFNCNSFDEKQIFKHIDMPGPVQRYFYMKKQKRTKHDINIYDI